jgi:Tol biopolymer transport system component
LIIALPALASDAAKAHRRTGSGQIEQETNGRYLDRPALDDLLTSAERAAQQPSQSLVEAIVYTTLRPPNWDIYLFDKPTGAPRRLTDDPALDYNAVFSPDGRWVVFTSERTGNTDLYAFDLKTGGPPIRLTQHHGMDDAASFSPDGRRLAFVSTRDGDADILVMPFEPADAAAEQRAVNLTRRSGGDFNPAFSPDGRRIAFSRQERWDDLNTPVREDQAVELYVMDADGSNVRRLSTRSAEPTHDGRPASFPPVSGSPAWSRADWIDTPTWDPQVPLRHS